jgi:hypothetical protein
MHRSSPRESGWRCGVDDRVDVIGAQDYGGESVQQLAGARPGRIGDLDRRVASRQVDQDAPVIGFDQE